MLIIKKIFIVSTILLLVLLVFFGIYIFAFKQDETGIVREATEEKDLDIKDLVGKKMTNITSDSVLAATIGPDGETVRYYDAIDGRAWTMTLRGTNREILKSETRDVPASVKWSPDGVSAILTYTNGDIYVYNHATNENKKLRSGMDSVEWAGIGGKILYKYFDEVSKERSLNIANADGTNWRKLADLPYRYAEFTQIPSSILAAFWPRQGFEVPSELYVVSTINAAEPKRIADGRVGADYLFSPSGKKILLNSSDENGDTTLGIMNSDGSEYTDLLIPTIVKKAVWSRDSEFVYYALPNDVPENVLWPDDYLASTFKTQDTFFKLDVASGKKTRIIELDEITEAVDAEDLFLSPTEDALYFTNRHNNLLYRLNL